MYVCLCVCSSGWFLCVNAFTHSCLSLQAFREPPHHLGSALSSQAKAIMGNSFGQDGTRMVERGDGSFSWVIPSSFQRSRVSPRPRLGSRSSSSPSSISRPQFTPHVIVSFLPYSLSPEKRVGWKKGRKIVIFSSPGWTEVTLQLERKPNTAFSSLSERTERRGQGEKGGNQSGSM